MIIINRLYSSISEKKSLDLECGDWAGGKVKEETGGYICRASGGKEKGKVKLWKGAEDRSVKGGRRVGGWERRWGSKGLTS